MENRRTHICDAVDMLFKMTSMPLHMEPPFHSRSKLVRLLTFACADKTHKTKTGERQKQWQRAADQRTASTSVEAYT